MTQYCFLMPPHGVDIDPRNNYAVCLLN